MSWMNQGEIEGAAKAEHACPNVRKGVRLLLKLMEAVNEQSDGWPYWNPPSKAAAKLQDLLQSAGNDNGRMPLYYGTRTTISEKDLTKAFAPIRAFVTRAKTGKYGGKFEFDIDAVLNDFDGVLFKEK